MVRVFVNSLARIRTEVSPIMSQTLYPLSYQAVRGCGARKPTANG